MITFHFSFLVVLIYLCVLVFDALYITIAYNEKGILYQTPFTKYYTFLNILCFIPVINLILLSLWLYDYPVKSFNFRLNVFKIIDELYF